MTKYRPDHKNRAMSESGKDDEGEKGEDEDPLDPETRRIFEESMKRNKEALERLAEL